MLFFGGCTLGEKLLDINLYSIVGFDVTGRT